MGQGPATVPIIDRRSEMDPHEQFKILLAGDAPFTALAPMQDVTDLPFMRLLARYGAPDIFFTEYFRVYPNSRLDKHILRSITENDTGRPVVAQLIGNDIGWLTRTARELENHPIAAVDLNLGCPAPVVYRKCAGGGLLREPDRIDRILGALRDAVAGGFTVKTRVGFDSPQVFDELLTVFARHDLDMLTVHGRTVKEAYKSAVHYDLIARAAEALDCPVLANGNVYSAQKAETVIARTGVAGIMIGRGAIRNPWIFEQISQKRRGQPMFVPKGHDALAYIRDLFESVKPPDITSDQHVRKMKKYMNFVGLGVEPTGRFLHEIRRAATVKEFFAICERFLDNDEPTPLEPFELPLGERDVLAGVHT